MKKLHFFLLLFCLVTLFSCEEDQENPPINNDRRVEITSFSPTSTYIKTAVEIEGNVSFDTLRNFRIYVGNEPAEIVTINQSKLTVKVPVTLIPGEYPISIAYENQTAISREKLSVLDHLELTVNGLAAITTDNSMFPIIANNENGEHLVLMSDEQNGSITGVIYMHDTIQNVVWFNEEGLPETLESQGYTFVFDNYTETSVDIGIVDPNSEVQIFREISLEEMSAQRQTISNARTNNSEIAIALQSAAFGLSLTSCAIAGPLALTGIPLAVINGVVSCGSALLSLANTLSEGDNVLLEGSSIGFGIFADHLGCAQVISFPYVDGVASCASLVLNLAGVILGDAEENQQRNAESIEVARQALQYQGGDVQITLTWNNSADLDLHVIDPNGERIYYLHPFSASGGGLDVDDTDGFGPENIFWPPQQSPAGTYQVEVVHYSGAAPASFTVLVQALGQTRQYNGTVGEGQAIGITTFTLGESLPEGRFETISLNARMLSPKK